MEEHICSTCESPIEEKVHAALIRISNYKSLKISPQKSIFLTGGGEHKCHGDWCWCSEGGRHGEWCSCYGGNYWSYEKYRLDFFIQNMNICIECDGEEFHDEKRDEKRDGWLFNKYGIITIRLSGELIHSSSEKRIIKILSKRIFGEDYSNKIVAIEKASSINKTLRKKI